MGAVAILLARGHLGGRGDHKLGTVTQRDERFVGELVETRGRAPVGLLREIVLTDNGR